MDYLNTGDKSYQIMLDRIKDETKIVRNVYVIDKKKFDVKTTNNFSNMENIDMRGTNINEFF